MAPKKSKTTKASLKKAGTMAATAAAGQEFLKQAWGEDKLNRVNALLEARDKSDTNDDSDTPSASSPADAATTSSSVVSKTKAKPTLSKARTMKSTAKVCQTKTLIGTEVLGDTRSETKRRQAAVKAQKTLQEVTKPTSGRKPAIKRLGTMANTAREGKAYIKRTAGSKQKGKSTTGRKRTGGRVKKSSK
ncbi:unnamed protein product [Rotaria sp. Silwood2]|nr:unnamed protein product [Rotaria sp. Silwood2]CAF2647287.1 unnamed protein product [Rotaria sp. Silwood2]CAF2866948.1 unnamed protein product [Rotaria sp. Silwood2]CAF3040552.1 unnamed protein product [Rotaria sp. Silwood2]CAF3999875.1 unnamed protein product [Rotaria sp. Silwood2]